MIENLSTFARTTIEAGRKADRNYVELVAHFALTSDSTSGEITDAARAVVIAAFPKVTEADMKGRDNGTHAWRDARMVRAGLVRNIEAADAEDGDPKPVILRVSLSGEGGGNTVIEPTHPMYAALVMLVTGEADLTDNESKAA